MTPIEITTIPQLLDVALSDLHESPLNPRRHFDKAALDELAHSIKAKGVLNPALARPRVGGGYEFAAGHRRYRASKIAKRPTMPVLVRRMTEEEFLTILVVDNDQREDVHPLDQATGYQRLLELPGYDVAAVSAKVGKSESFIYQRLQLMQLTPAAQKLFLEDRMTPGHAVILARLQPNDQAEALKSYVFQRETSSVATLRQWVQQNVLCTLGDAGFALDDAQLVPAAGACTACPKRTGHQRELLPSLDDGGGKKKSERCLDPTCFAGKIKAHVAQRRVELEAKHGPLVPITLDRNYGTPAKKGEPLNASQWWPAKTNDPGSKAAIVVDGDGLGQLKHITTIRPKEAPRADNRYAKQERAVAEKRKRDKQRRRRIFDALRAKLTDEMGHGSATALIDGYIHEMQNESVKDVCRIYGIEAAKRSGSYGIDWTGPLRKYIADLTTKDAVIMLKTLPLIADLDRTWFGDNRPDTLIREATRMRIDVKAIDAALAKEASAAAAAKKQKAKPAAKVGPRKKLAGDVRRAAGKQKAKR